MISGLFSSFPQAVVDAYNLVLNSPGKHGQMSAYMLTTPNNIAHGTTCPYHPQGARPDSFLIFL